MAGNSSNKRKAEHAGADNKAKKQKNWQTTKQVNWSGKAGKEIHIGDVGIWVTCDRGREGKCVAELLDVLDEYAQNLYGDSIIENASKENGDDNEDEPSDIENAISSELKDLSTKKSTGLFQVVRPDIACVMFIKTRKPIDPVKLVHSLCKDAAAGLVRKSCRFVKRLTPATSTDKAYEGHFEELATRIIKPIFDAEANKGKTFAIRYTSRNHNVLNRDDVIKTTAKIVGEHHKVDLDHPQLVILIEVYKIICTIAVVDGDYSALKRYNLSELGNSGVNETSSRVSKTADIGAEETS